MPLRIAEWWSQLKSSEPYLLWEPPRVGDDGEIVYDDERKSMGRFMAQLRQRWSDERSAIYKRLSSATKRLLECQGAAIHDVLPWLRELKQSLPSRCAQLVRECNDHVNGTDNIRHLIATTQPYDDRPCDDPEFADHIEGLLKGDRTRALFDLFEPGQFGAAKLSEWLDEWIRRVEAHRNADSPISPSELFGLLDLYADGSAELESGIWSPSMPPCAATWISDPLGAELIRKGRALLTGPKTKLASDTFEEQTPSLAFLYRMAFESAWFDALSQAPNSLLGWYKEVDANPAVAAGLLDLMLCGADTRGGNGLQLSSVCMPDGAGAENADLAFAILRRWSPHFLSKYRLWVNNFANGPAWLSQNTGKEWVNNTGPLAWTSKKSASYALLVNDLRTGSPFIESTAREVAPLAQFLLTRGTSELGGDDKADDPSSRASDGLLALPIPVKKLRDCVLALGPDSNSKVVLARGGNSDWFTLKTPNISVQRVLWLAEGRDSFPLSGKDDPRRFRDWFKSVFAVPAIDHIEQDPLPVSHGLYQKTWKQTDAVKDSRERQISKDRLDRKPAPELDYEARDRALDDQ